jgi:hypothetical protein
MRSWLGLPYLVAGFVVSALAGGTGKMGVVSRASQDSRTLVRFLSQLGEHSGGIGGCLAYPGSGGICTDLTGKLGGGAGGVAQPDSHNSASTAISGSRSSRRLNFSGVGFSGISQLLFGFAVARFLIRAGRLCRQSLRVQLRLHSRCPGLHALAVDVQSTPGK